MILAVTGVRTKIIRMIPKSVMLATSAGIGLYLAHIGLQKSEGLNVVTYDSATIVTLGESLVSTIIFHVITCYLRNFCNMHVLRQVAQQQVQFRMVIQIWLASLLSASYSSYR